LREAATAPGSTGAALAGSSPGSDVAAELLQVAAPGDLVAGDGGPAQGQGSDVVDRAPRGGAASPSTASRSALAARAAASTEAAVAAVGSVTGRIHAVELIAGRTGSTFAAGATDCAVPSIATIAARAGDTTSGGIAGHADPIRVQRSRVVNRSSQGGTAIASGRSSTTTTATTARTRGAAWPAIGFGSERRRWNSWTPERAIPAGSSIPTATASPTGATVPTGDRVVHD
jgi:hypothetical protein